MKTLNAHEAAKLLGISTVALWTRVRKGEIPVTKPAETQKRGVGRPPIYGFDPEVLERIRDSLRSVGTPRRYPAEETSRLQMRASASEIDRWDREAKRMGLSREDWLRHLASEYLSVAIDTKGIVTSLPEDTDQFWLRAAPEESEIWMVEARRHRVAIAGWFRSLASYHFAGSTGSVTS